MQLQMIFYHTPSSTIHIIINKLFRHSQVFIAIQMSQSKLSAEFNLFVFIIQTLYHPITVRLQGF